MNPMRTLLVVGLSLFAVHGGHRTLLYRSPNDAVGPPAHARFSPDRRFVPYDEHPPRYGARARVYRIDVASGRRHGPLATVAPVNDSYGHHTWRDLPLLGKTIAVDPGHNGANWAHPAEIGRLVDAGGFRKACDTTGTSTADGISETWYDLDVAVRLARILRHRGARVVLTRKTNDGVGPCIDERAAIGNRAHADAAISIHADGGPSTGRGFQLLEADKSVGGSSVDKASRRLAVDLHASFVSESGLIPSDYVGTNGYEPRDDLAGLNLSSVPKIMAECGNMRNGSDLALQESSSGRAKMAKAIADGIIKFLSS